MQEVACQVTLIEYTCRHPLLLGRHLLEKEKTAREQRQGKNGAQLRRLSNRKQSTLPTPANNGDKQGKCLQPAAS